MTRQSEFKHAVGNENASDVVTLSIRRNDDEFDFKIKLAAKIDPWDQPFLGIIPDRTSDELAVADLFDHSAAKNAGIEVGDILRSINGKPIAAFDEFWDALVPHQLGTELTLGIQRGNKTIEVVCEPTSVLNDVLKTEPQLLAKENSIDRNLQTGLVDISIVDEDNRAVAYVPETIDRFSSIGLIVSIGPPATIDDQKFESTWKETCNARGWIVLTVEPLDTTTWSRTEAGFFQKMIAKMLRDYPIDPRRVSIWGENSGGSYALFVALSNKDMIRGVVALNADFPRGISALDTDPQSPLSIFWSQEKEKEDEASDAFEKIVKTLEAKKFPIISKRGSKPEELHQQVVDWIDTLDRF